jgi:hypothetical protein
MRRSIAILTAVVLLVMLFKPQGLHLGSMLIYVLMGLMRAF